MEVALVLFPVVVFLTFATILKKNKGLLFKMVFPLLYYLYAHTRLGYYHHLRRLKNKRKAPHSIVEPVQIGASTVSVIPLPILEDNYSYLVMDTKNKLAVVVDPADPQAIIKAVKQYNVQLKAILTTHKHWDHAGGNEVLKAAFPSITVYGGKLDKPSATTYLLEDKDKIVVGDLQFKAMLTVGHTVGHMVYLLLSTPKCLFSGDHLFIASCGKIFEGTPYQMLNSLISMKQLEPETFIFPGHEYSFTSLQFASSLEPDNAIVKKKYLSVQQLRARRLATIPSTIREELQYNPFLRTHSSMLRVMLGLDPDCSEDVVLATLRKRKDNFTPIQT